MPLPKRRASSGEEERAPGPGPLETNGYHSPGDSPSKSHAVVPQGRPSVMSVNDSLGPMPMRQLQLVSQGKHSRSNIEDDYMRVLSPTKSFDVCDQYYVGGHQHNSRRDTRDESTFEELIVRLARCHEQLQADKEDLRKQVMELTGDKPRKFSMPDGRASMASMASVGDVPNRFRQRHRSNSYEDLAFTYTGSGVSVKSLGLKLPSRISNDNGELSFQPKNTESSWGAVSEGSRMPPLQFSSERQDGDYGHPQEAGVEASLMEPTDRWAHVVKELLRANGSGVGTGDQLASALGRLVHTQSIAMRESQSMNSTPRQSVSDECNKRRRCACGCRLQRFVVSPISAPRLAWSMIGFVLLAWDALMIPMQVFTIGEFGIMYMADLKDFFAVLRAFSIFTSFFWLLDMPFQCFVSFQYADGTEERRLSRIIWNYAKTWLCLDIAVLVVDWGLLVADDLFQGSVEVGGAANAPDASFMKVGRYLRIARLVRLLRLIRIMRLRKFNEFMSHAVFRIKSQHVILGIKLAKHVVLILLVNHYIACSWYGLAALNTNSLQTWLDTYAETDNSLLHVYFMALHWSMTQFSPATNNIAPQNRLERIFAVCVVLFALISFSSFVSSVTNTVNQLRTLNMEPQMEEGRIREFLFTRKVSNELVGNILSFFRQNYKGSQKRLYEEDINFFQDVPETMKIRLHEEIYMPILSANAMFGPIVDLGKAQLVQVCHTAFSELFYLPQQDVFVDGRPSSGVYFVSSGRLFYHYSLVQMVPACSELEQATVEEGAWISELSLWLDWDHVGQLCADTSCELVKIDKVQFNTITAKAGGPLTECLKRFAAFVIGHIEGANLPVTDLSLGPETLGQLSVKARRLWELQHRSSGHKRSSSRRKQRLSHHSAGSHSSFSGYGRNSTNASRWRAVTSNTSNTSALLTPNDPALDPSKSTDLT